MVVRVVVVVVVVVIVTLSIKLVCTIGPSVVVVVVVIIIVIVSVVIGVVPSLAPVISSGVIVRVWVVRRPIVETIFLTHLLVLSLYSSLNESFQSGRNIPTSIERCPSEWFSAKSRK